MGFSKKNRQKLLIRSRRCCCVCNDFAGRASDVHHITPEAKYIVVANIDPREVLTFRLAPSNGASAGTTALSIELMQFDKEPQTMAQRPNESAISFSLPEECIIRGVSMVMRNDS